MLLRTHGQAMLAITQPVHASVSGQLAREWGNDLVGSVVPHGEVQLGTELHDIGWLDWESAPTLNAETGLPHTFMQLPTNLHLSIWGPASQLALPFGRYAALLVSMHGTALYAFHDYTGDSPDEAVAARAFVERERAFQHAVVEAMRSDPVMAKYADEETIRRNQRLVATWDGMSLAICSGVRGSRVFRNVPAARDVVDITFRSDGPDVRVDPWPFTSDTVTVRFEGRAITGPFEHERQMRDALATAEFETIECRLCTA